MAVFCSSLTSCFPGMSLTYFLNNFEVVPVAPIITGITFLFTFHMRYISIVRSWYFRVFSASFLITFLSPEIATSINIHVPFSLSRIIMSGLLLGIVLLLLLLLNTVNKRTAVTYRPPNDPVLQTLGFSLSIRCQKTVTQLSRKPRNAVRNRGFGRSKRQDVM